MASRGKTPKKGLEQLAALVDGATVVPFARGEAPPADDPRFDGAPEPEEPQSGGRDPDDGLYGLPDDCPVIPLGTCNGMYFFLDELKQLRELKAKELEKGNIEALFGRKVAQVDKIWPRYSNKKDINGDFIITGWKPEIAARSLRLACARLGIWSAEGKVRGEGAWRDDDGNLILHCGDKIWIAGADEGHQWHEPGKIADLVYPAGRKLPRPAVTPADPSEFEQLEALIATWRWERRDIDARLLLGWIAAAPICGALKWRPAAWVTGGRGTGKSALQTLIKSLMGGDAGLIEAASATEAYIRQLLGKRTLPVALDELEADADDRKQQAIIQLARYASSGAKMGRGGSDHNPHDFIARSSFLFSSILVPPLSPQDRSRMAMLELNPFEDSDVEPKLDPRALGQLGRAIRRRMVDQWHRLARTIDIYQDWLGHYGHDARMKDQFGTLLACADCLLYDHEPSDEEAEIWARKLDARHLAEKADDTGEGELCARYIATSQLQGRGGDEPESVAMWIEKTLIAVPMLVGEQDSACGKAQRRLEMSGMLVVAANLDDGKAVKRHTGGPGPAGAKQDVERALYVAVANSHRGLDGMLRDMRWKGGVWSQALGRVQGAHKRVKVRIGGRGEWATLVPLAVFSDQAIEEPDA
ncbi:hypothetical protein [Sphingomonas sp. LaA6.9]|uniref:hypothetical protein n=1 Tax=Sphingomonas sp. LaA6.9 TaxID=2919914 RepID=UPI001F4FEAEE|nr:hypothetical protein [Sphingomonas sp. LaA6.9]MCJ8158842.1 hypothetical protein [Sphingomonas sp. LaA6.9]